MSHVPLPLFVGFTHGKARDQELAKLRRELKKVTEERNFLRDAASYFAKELYLAVVMDLYSRRIIGGVMDLRVGKRLPIDALTMALGYRQPQGAMLHHSDRGPQNASDDLRDVLNEDSIRWFD